MVMLLLLVIPIAVNTSSTDYNYVPSTVMERN